MWLISDLRKVNIAIIWQIILLFIWDHIWDFLTSDSLRAPPPFYIGQVLSHGAIVSCLHYKIDLSNRGPAAVACSTRDGIFSQYTSGTGTMHACMQKNLTGLGLYTVPSWEIFYLDHCAESWVINAKFHDNIKKCLSAKDFRPYADLPLSFIVDLYCSLVSLNWGPMTL